MYQVLSDVRYGFRALLKARGLTVIAVLTLAIAIGANTAIFSVVNAAMLRPLPYPNAARLVSIYHAYTKFKMNFVTVSPDFFRYYREHAKSFEEMAAYTSFHAPANLTGTGDPQRIKAWKANASFFRILGTRPALGRTFTDQEDQPGASRVAVVSYGAWQSIFGGASILGKDVTLDGANYTVVGIMPKDFEFPAEAQVWIPMAFTPEELNGGSEFLQVIATLKPGVSPVQAQAEMSQMTRELLARDNDTGNRNGWSANTMPLQPASVSDIKTALWILLGAVGCVLLIACANIANLLLARATARQKEIAIRMALGASRWRISRQLLTEGVLLGVIGGCIGLVFAYGGLDLLLKLVPAEIPAYIHVEIDRNVLAFTFGVSVFTGVLFSVLPALQITRRDNSETLKEGGRTSAAAGKHIVRAGIAVGQLALAMILLVSAGLLMKTFMRIQQADMGFNAENVLTFRTNLPEEKYKDNAKTLSFYDQLLQRLRSIRGVKSAAITSQLPLTRNMSSVYNIQGKTFDTPPHSHVGLIGPEYFATLQIPVLSGRVFTEADRGTDTPQVAIIDDNTARAYFSDRDPIGQKISFSFEGKEKEPIWRTIVGVVHSVKHTSPLENETKGQVFLPFEQIPLFPQMIVTVRTEGDPTTLVSDARRLVLGVDPSQPIEEVQTMDEVVNTFVAQPRFNMVLLGLFAVIALVLSGIGIYGVISYSVTQRTREIGVRMALGASTRHVLREVLVQGARIALIGLTGGLIGTFIASRALSTLLYGVRPLDPVTYMEVALLLAVIALLASFVPARRATRVDPVIALRSE